MIQFKVEAKTNITSLDHQPGCDIGPSLPEAATDSRIAEQRLA